MAKMHKALNINVNYNGFSSSGIFRQMSPRAQHIKTASSKKKNFFKVINEFQKNKVNS